MHCMSACPPLDRWPAVGVGMGGTDPGASCSLAVFPVFQGFQRKTEREEEEEEEDVTAEVMLVTFPWMTSVSNLHLPRLCLCLSSKSLFPPLSHPSLLSDIPSCIIQDRQQPLIRQKERRRRKKERGGFFEEVMNI